MTCTQVKKIWKYFQPTYEKLTKRQYTPQEHIFTLSANTLNSKNKKLILTLTQLSTKYGHPEIISNMTKFNCHRKLL